MSPVHTLQRRFRELGRVKMGAVVPTSSGKTRPSALEKWRLTAYGAVGQHLLTQAAQHVGGEPRPWANAPQGGGWELFTESDALEIVVPPLAEPFTVWLEKWTAAGCERRCDGERAQVYGGRKVGWRTGPCRCTDPTNPLQRECTINFRFTVLLPWIDGLGTWHVHTHSYHGAEELQGALAVLGSRAADGLMTPAKLRIERRETRRPAVGPDGSTKVEVSKFVVPVIDVEQTLTQLMRGEGERIALPSSARTPEGRPALPSGNPQLPTTPVSVATTIPARDDDPGPAWGEAPPVPEGDAAARGQVAEPVLEGEAIDPPDGDRLSAEDRRIAVAAWTALGFTQAEIQQVMHDIAGVESTAELTHTNRWAVEGELRRMSEERKGDAGA